MANLKEIRNRISSVTSTCQITSAMKMVSAAKLRKSQSAIQQLRPYTQLMAEITGRLSDGALSDIPALCVHKKEEKVLLVALTSNKGLCSTFNSSIVKLVNKRARYYTEQGVKVSVLSFGKRGTVAIRKMENIDFIGSDDEIWDKMSFDNVSKIADRLTDDYCAGKYDRVEIVYNIFKNAAVQYATAENMLPLSLQQSQDDKDNKHKNDYIFEPDKNEILRNIIPLFLHTQLYKCFLDSFTSEHGARMSSMNKATDNAQELLGELTLTYNKLRQAGITNEIIEICSGANALN